MRIVMRKTVTVSPNGTDVATFEAGKAYELNGERGEDLAALLLRDKAAFRSDKAIAPASGAKKADPDKSDGKGADEKDADGKGGASGEQDGA